MITENAQNSTASTCFIPWLCSWSHIAAPSSRSQHANGTQFQDAILPPQYCRARRRRTRSIMRELGQCRRFEVPAPPAAHSVRAL